MPFKPDPNATISSGELANRDATYMIVRFIHKDGPHRKESSTFGLSTSGDGLHAEEHFFKWCANSGNAAKLQQAFESGGRIMELLLTKSPCPKCTKLLIELARGLNGVNSKCGMDSMWITLVGMYKGINDPASKASLTQLHAQEPLIYLFAWSGKNADLFDPTDQVLINNIANFDDQASQSRQGTDVLKRTALLQQYFKTGLGMTYEESARIPTR
jgi:hypothetical protein